MEKYEKMKESIRMMKSSDELNKKRQNNKSIGENSRNA